MTDRMAAVWLGVEAHNCVSLQARYGEYITFKRQVKSRMMVARRVGVSLARPYRTPGAHPPAFGGLLFQPMLTANKPQREVFMYLSP